MLVHAIKTFSDEVRRWCNLVKLSYPDILVLWFGMDGGITNVKALLNVKKSDVHCIMIGFSPETFDNCTFLLS